MRRRRMKRTIMVILTMMMMLKKRKPLARTMTSMTVPELPAGVRGPWAPGSQTPTTAWAPREWPLPMTARKKKKKK